MNGNERKKSCGRKRRFIHYNLTSVDVTSFTFLGVLSIVSVDSMLFWVRLRCPLLLSVKDHRQRIPRFVIRRYLEKSIHKKLFCHLQSLQIKTISKKKTIINSISENLLSRFFYGRDVIGANCVEQRRPENGKNEMFLLLQLLLLQPNATQ